MPGPGVSCAARIGCPGACLEPRLVATNPEGVRERPQGASWLRQRASYRLRFALDGRRVSKGLHKPSHTGGLGRARQLQGNLLVLVTCLNREWGQGGGPPSRYALRRDSLRLSGEFARWLASRSSLRFHASEGWLACHPKLEGRALRRQPTFALRATVGTLRASHERRVAERVGFEPTVEFPLHTLSKRAPSTTRTSLRLESTTCERPTRIIAHARGRAGGCFDRHSIQQFTGKRRHVEAPNCVRPLNLV